MRLPTAFLVSFPVLAFGLDAHAQCPDLELRFEAPRADSIRALAIFDRGFGPELFAGSDRPELTAWDGERWSTIAGALDGPVNALLVHDFGAGPVLVVAGQFLHADGAVVNRIARFDGQDWSPLAAGFDGPVRALAVFDGGSGPRLVVAGNFSASGATPAANIASFDGSAWIPLAGGLDDEGVALAVFDAGGGAKLVAGGLFLEADGHPAAHIATWDGSVWSALAPGAAGGVDGEVRSLLSTGSAGSQALIVGGNFQAAGGFPASLIARFDGTAWSALGPGLDESSVFDGSVHALLADGAGCIAAGRFETFAPPGSVSTNVARWDGSVWQPLGPGLGVPLYIGVDALARFDPGDGGGSRIFAGGSFMPRTGQPRSIGQWDGSSWSALYDAEAQGLIHDPGQDGALSATLWQGELVIAGEFQGAGSAPSAQGVARWDGTRWRTLGAVPVGGSLDHPTLVRAVDRGAGSELVLGMVRSSAPEARVPLYRWNGAEWLPFEAIPPPSGTTAQIMDVAVFDGGDGPELFAGGFGLHPGGSSVAESIARWDGSAWNALPPPSGESAPAVDGTVACLQVFDDGSGPALYAGGRMPGSIVRWDGSAWSVVGTGFTGLVGSDTFVSGLAVFDDGDGSGARLYAGGAFVSAGSVSVPGVARWNGTAWEAVPGVAPGFPGVTDFEVFGDASGAGPRLYAMDLGDDIWAFDGGTWTRIGFTEPYFTGGRLTAFEALPGGGGLVIHGNYREVFEVGDEPVALPGFTILRGCPRTASFCAGDGSGGLAPGCPCGNSGASGHGCQNSAGTGGALLQASGQPSLGADTLVLTSTGERPTALSVFLQGSVQIAPANYGDGLRCTGGALKRLYVRNAVGGVVTAPAGADPSISARSAALGHVIGAETTRYYQVFYRDPSPSFCPAPPGGTFNVSNGIRAVWSP